MGDVMPSRSDTSWPLTATTFRVAEVCDEERDV
jgi:hypothetical protein